MSESYKGELTKISDILYEYEYAGIKVQINEREEANDSFRFKANVKSVFFDTELLGDDVAQLALALDYDIDSVVSILESIKTPIPDTLKKAVVYSIKKKIVFNQEKLIDLVNVRALTCSFVDLIELGTPTKLIYSNYTRFIALLLGYLLNNQELAKPTKKKNARKYEAEKITQLLSAINKGTSNPNLTDLIDLTIQNPKTDDSKKKSLTNIQCKDISINNIYLKDLLLGYLWGLENKLLFEPMSKYNFKDAKILNNFDTNRDNIRLERTHLKHIEDCFDYIPTSVWNIFSVAYPDRDIGSVKRNYQLWKSGNNSKR